MPKLRRSKGIGLRCQYDVAYPVLKKRGLTAFWFVYTSPLEGVLEKIELYRHFRFSKFADVEDFYAAFFALAEKSAQNVATALQNYNPDEHLREFPFYTPNDKRFRYLRDVVLGVEKYNALMDEMIASYNYDVTENAKILWLEQSMIKKLSDDGNIVGLHSHTHPTVMINCDYAGQKREYARN